ncbi:MAG: SMI1/KNR4 family protein [Planctomycetes bacterium]|jgi:hypothetical protein|nr:SMI1/KNR4 family protein [Planctomycetota bacterium]MCL4730268.1 SMI1/KNR4 family protein [Planctomycetota bacterium]
MPDYKPLIDQIAQKSGVSFRKAGRKDLKKLAKLRLPESVAEFYREYEPTEPTEDPVRIWPLEALFQENEEGIPGICTSRHGYVVFASNHNGDAYCFDLTSGQSGDPPIVLISHDEVDEDSPAEQVARAAVPVADNLGDFLKQFAAGTLRTE